jgi:hypothetical protein
MVQISLGFKHLARSLHGFLTWILICGLVACGGRHPQNKLLCKKRFVVVSAAAE